MKPHKEDIKLMKMTKEYMDLLRKNIISQECYNTSLDKINNKI